MNSLESLKDEGGEAGEKSVWKGFHGRTGLPLAALKMEGDGEPWWVASTSWKRLANGYFPGASRKDCSPTGTLIFSPVSRTSGF